MADVDTEKMSVDDAIKYFGTSIEKGLESSEVQKRLKEFGYNEVQEKKEKAWRRLAKKFWGVTPFMLEFTMVFSIIIKSYLDAYIIAALLVVNAIIGFTQEEKASRAVELLKKKLQVNARVLRDGKWIKIPARELVPGDIVRVRAGDFVPADLKILSEGEIEVDQSALTGESMPVLKKIGDILYSGSIIRRGEATALVTKTGNKTYFGRTTELVQLARPKLHMEKIAGRIVNYLLVIVLVLISAMFIFSYIRHMDMIRLIPLSLMLVVFAVPVALPAMFTVSMAVGSLDIAKKGVLLTRLSAIEDAASMDTLCADKTGTLTMNKLALKSVLAIDCDENDVILYGALASEEANQDPIDLAFINEARSRKIKSEYVVKRFIPFSPSTRRTEVVVEKNGSEMRIAKGAVDVIYNICGREMDDVVRKKMEEFARSGYRTLAVSFSSNNECKICGLVALYDPPREDTRDLIKKLNDLGISVKMLTGDAEPIAKQIAYEIGIGDKILRSSELKEMKKKDPVRAANLAEESNGFAEIYPEDKYVIVKSLQAKGHIVGMTGDGINDAPALKQAEVGIAVSNATDVAKGAASAVLTSEGLSNIVDLVKEGRIIYQRMVTWVLNKIVKTFEIAVFVSLAFLITGYYVLSAMDIVLFLFLIDFVTISISTDSERGSRNPEKWDISRLFKFSMFLGIFTTIEIFILLFIGENYFKIFSDTARMNTFFFTAIMFFGLFMPLIIRERDHFWSSRPGKTLMISIIIDVVAVSILSTLGLGLLKPVTMDEYIFILMYTIFSTFIINDLAKIMLEKFGLSR
ncbi:MAG: plasma-membrane proton-efflux P-type ATPase [Thermoplasmata archaeon]|nr:plasma-membrane proton-efflux P-type ATPase [Thermoplasmata archaeon]